MSLYLGARVGDRLGWSKRLVAWAGLPVGVEACFYFGGEL
jgi:hypothetical protein